jgi:uncharacterized protein YndB with AHSA1/START domain
MTDGNTLRVTTLGEREVVITRTFDAPRQLVYDAMTKPELLGQWFYGPPGWTLAVCDVDLRPGGAYRYVWKSADGVSMGMGGTHQEVVPPERVVATQLFDEDWTGGEALSVMTFTERNGKTTLTITMTYASREARDAVLRTPMEQGMAMGYDRLAALLPTL